MSYDADKLEEVKVILYQQERTILLIKAVFVNERSRLQRYGHE